MNIYEKKSNWKVLLALLGVVILLITIFYANYLANSLKRVEEANLRIYVNAYERLADTKDINADVTFETQITDNLNIPIIQEDADGTLYGKNFHDSLQNEDQDFLQGKINQFMESGTKPIIGPGFSLYYFDSYLMGIIKYFPWLMIVLISFFVGFAYYLFSSGRRAEQNRVWAGMAKETAHQLGTPISAILAWIEHLKEDSADSPARMEIIGELSNDVNRLELIADRFSKIGSTPALEPVNVYDQIEKCMAYMKRRAPRRVVFNTYSEHDKADEAMMNKHLFDWVIENLLRNALDAMPGVGTISANVYKENEYICIDIEDSGKGIPSSKFKTVFQPGFSTKKRGWGLGLSLAKRIIENYHSGKIFVKSSKPNEGTCFSVKLPKVG